MKKAFVTGWPINQSKSPMLHGFWLKQYNITGSYEAHSVAPENFEKFLKELPRSDLAGGNVTLPHKEIAFANVDYLDEAAKAIGAVNTLWIEDKRLHGGNTDAYGFSANMDQYAPDWKNRKTATILGAGGAARAIIHAVQKADYQEIHIVNRTLERAENLCNLFGQKCQAYGWEAIPNLLSKTDLLINTTSIGMAGSDASMMPDLSNLPSTASVSDIVYVPLETPFLKAANGLGLKTVDGLGMLLHQAVPGFEKWFGIRPEVTDELREYILGLSS